MSVEGMSSGLISNNELLGLRAFDQSEAWKWTLRPLLVGVNRGNRRKTAQIILNPIKHDLWPLIRQNKKFSRIKMDRCIF